MPVLVGRKEDPRKKPNKISPLRENIQSWQHKETTKVDHNMSREEAGNGSPHPIHTNE